MTGPIFQVTQKNINCKRVDLVLGRTLKFLHIVTTRENVVMTRSCFQYNSSLVLPSHALSNDIFYGIKFETLHNTFLWCCQIWRHNLTFWLFEIEYPRYHPEFPSSILTLWVNLSRTFLFLDAPATGASAGVLIITIKASDTLGYQPTICALHMRTTISSVQWQPWTAVSAFFQAPQHDVAVGQK